MRILRKDSCAVLTAAARAEAATAYLLLATGIAVDKEVAPAAKAA